MESCILIPTVKNSKGEEVESNLFKVLNATYGRNLAVDIYVRAVHDSFKNDYKDKIVLDDLGEPTLASLQRIKEVRDFIGDSKILDNIVEKNGLNKNFNTLSEAIEKAKEFNSLKEGDINNKYIALVDTEKGSYFVKIEPRTTESNNEAKTIFENHEVLNEIKTLIKDNSSIKSDNIEEAFKRTFGEELSQTISVKDIVNDIRNRFKYNQGLGEDYFTKLIPNLIIAKFESDGNVSRLNKLKDYVVNSGLISNLQDNSSSQQEVLIREKIADLIQQRLDDLKASTGNTEIDKTIWNMIDITKNNLKKIDNSEIIKKVEDAGRKANDAYDNFTDSDGFASRAKSIIKELEKVTELGDSMKKAIDSKVKKIADKIIEQEKKRQVFYSNRKQDANFRESQNRLLTALRTEADPYMVVSRFLYSALTRLTNVYASDKKLEEMDRKTRNSFLINMKNYINSYVPLLEMCRDMINYNRTIWKDFTFKVGDNTYTIDDMINEVTNVASNVSSMYEHYSQQAILNGKIGAVIDSIPEQSLGKNKGKKVNAEEELDKYKNHKDISVFERWFLPLSDSFDPILQAVDRVAQEARQDARLQTIEDSTIIEAAEGKLRKAGVRDHDFMFQRKKDGTIDTLHYLDQYDYNAWLDDVITYKDKIKKEFENKYGLKETWNDEVKKDYNKITGKKAIKERFKYKKYVSEGYKKLMNDNSEQGKAKREYYNTFISMFTRYKEMLPPGSFRNNSDTIKILKDNVERFKNAKTISEYWDIAKSTVKDSLYETASDNEFGGVNAMGNFAGEEYYVLPVYYTRLGSKDKIKDISTDTTATLEAFAQMANYNSRMSEDIDELELTRDMIYRLPVSSMSGGKPKIQVLDNLKSKIVTEIKKKQGSSNRQARLDDYMMAQIYHKYYKDEGTVGNTKIPVAKMANLINSLTAHKGYALNLPASIANVIVGDAMINVEAICGQFYTETEKMKADWKYNEMLPALLAETGKAIKTSKLALIDETFNVLQNYERKFTEKNFDRKSRVAQSISWQSAMFGGTEMGEHWLQNRTALAMLLRHQLLDKKTGNKISLLDALEVRYIDEHNHDLGARLALKEGVTNLDGSEIEFNKLVKQKENQIKKVNQDIHGIYNKDDANAFQQIALGRMVMMYRRYLVPSLMRRFGSAQYRYLLEGTPAQYRDGLFGEKHEYLHDGWTEGYYRSLFTFTSELIKSIKKQQFSIATTWDSLTYTQKSNVIRSATELVQVIALGVLVSLLDFKDMKNKPWYIRMAKYQAMRVFTELAALTPSPYMPEEFFKILNSPMASIQILQGGLDILNLMNPWGWTNELEGGLFKGHSTNFRNLVKDLPYGYTLYKDVHPELGINYLQKGM